MDETTGAYGAITVERPGEFRGFAYVIKQLELALRRRLMDACRESGLTSAQYTALSVLVRRPGLTSSELAEKVPRACADDGDDDRSDARDGVRAS